MCLRASCVLLVVYMCVCATRPCLIISEINSDNPQLDTKEFVELFSFSGGATSLDGFTLVLYNGRGNVAYRVLDLSGHSTDERGFFLIGSSELKPSPAIHLPPNSIQNGPDAIALYGPSWKPVSEGGHASAVGLLDAIVYTTSWMRGTADTLAQILTPGSAPHVEDDAALKIDVSIQRCWLSDNYYSFQIGGPTPGRANDCTPRGPRHLWIYRILLGGVRPAGPVELSIGSEKGPMALVVYDAGTTTVRTSVGFQARTGNVTVDLDTTNLSDLDGWALAVYTGQASDFPKGSVLSDREPVDAFVFAGLKSNPNLNLTEVLIPGRKAFQLDSGAFEGSDATFTRCGGASWTRDPGVFQLQVGRPSESRRCAWYNTCPYSAALNATDEPVQTLLTADTDFLLSEVNTDSPGSNENEEFVELWHPSGRRTSLDNVWLLFFNGKTGKIYREIELHGFHTDTQGFFLIGSDKLKPHLSLRPNTIQNGPDAIAIYRSEHPPSSKGVDIPTVGLLDAIVYRSRGSDREAVDLVQALTPGQLPLLEASGALEGDESLSRCGLKRFDMDSFRVTSPTPTKDNCCPRPPKELLLNEVGVAGARRLNQTIFVELSGPATTDLHGMVVVMLEIEGAKHIIELKGSIGGNGLYLLANDIPADQHIPAVHSLTAVLLCHGLPSICSNSTKIQDVVVVANQGSLHPLLHGVTYQFIETSSRFDSVSRCATKGPAAWSLSASTPSHQNRCPSSTYSTSVDLCLQMEHFFPFNCTVAGFYMFMEHSCECGIAGPHLTDVNISCTSGSAYVQGDVLAVSERQREAVSKALQEAAAYSCTAAQERLINRESPLGLQVGLVLAVVLLSIVGGAISFYLYKKKRPQDYYSMELNEHEDPTNL